MKIIGNGFPKSGNHALRKMIELLGQRAFGGVNHIPYDATTRLLWDSSGAREWHGLPDDCTHHVFIKRDPRNVIISQLRLMPDVITPGKFLARFRAFNGNHSLVDEMARYEGWLHDERTHVVMYEDLIASDEAARSIADYLGSPYFDNAFEDLPDDTATWNPVHSDFRELWTHEVQAAWSAEGGDALLRRWGYDG